MSPHSFMSYSQIQKHMPLIKELDVSERARSRGQFLEQYKKYGSKLPKQWLKKREAFIARHLAQYKKNKTIM